MNDYNVKDRIITKEDWEKWLKMKEEYSDRHLSNIPETPTKKENKYAVIEWHPYPKEKPPKEDDYLVTLVVGVKPFTHYLHYAPFTLGRGSKWAHVTAWMDNPEPYKEEV